MSNQHTNRYSDADLAEFKELIDQKLQKARQELDYLDTQIREYHENSKGQTGGDISDDSSKHTEVEMLSDMASRQRQFILNLENALLRIRNKTYGICTVTGQLIDKKRLMLVPHATKSIAAKEGGTAVKQSSTEKSETNPDTKSKARPAAKKIITKVVNKSESPKSKKKKTDWEEENEDDDTIIELELDDIPEEDLDDQD